MFEDLVKSRVGHDLYSLIILHSFTLDFLSF